MSGSNVRAAAARAVLGVVKHKRSLEDALAEVSEDVADKDLSLLRELASGTLRWQIRYAALLNRLLDKPLKQKDQDLHCLICTGLYQFDHTRIPHHAVVAETVGVTAVLGKTWAKGLVNAILRRYQRERDSWNRCIEDEAVEYACPQWLVDRLKKSWPDNWRWILAAQNKKPPLTLRVNQKKISRDAFCEKLVESNLAYSVTEDSPVGITLGHALPIEKIPGFHQGLISVQDESAQLAALVLSLFPKPSNQLYVLDACAAPGGKTGHLLEAAEIDIELTAVDLPQRTTKIQENLHRLNLTADVVSADLLAPDTWWNGQVFDFILLDAPCSGTGVIRRHPDIKHLRLEKDISENAKTQSALLEVLWKTLKPNGHMLYTTCSILPDENENLIQQFLQHQSDAVLFSLPESYGQQCTVGRQRLPGVHSGDGFFYALLERK